VFLFEVGNRTSNGGYNKGFWSLYGFTYGIRLATIYINVTAR